MALPCLALTAGVAWLGCRTGSELSVSILYLVLVLVLVAMAMSVWQVGGWFGYAACGLSALGWYLADMATGHVYSHEAIPVWNALVRLGFFGVTAYWLGRIKHMLLRLTALAERDALTGLLNHGAFVARADAVLAVARREHRPVALAFMGLDGFKRVNDTSGHAADDAARRGAGAGACATAIRAPGWGERRVCVAAALYRSARRARRVRGRA
ncbi:MAG: diguanylate cyclase [Pseudomonadota bacterium]|nr:diguanylate cyclase [Pseudomonadota bacterium]